MTNTFIVQILLFLCLLAGCSSTGMTINISQQDIQNQINEVIPYEKTFKDRISVIIEQITPELRNGEDRIYVTAYLKVGLKIGQLSIPWRAQILADSALRYDQFTYTFFLVRPNLKLSLDLVPEKYMDQANEAISQVFGEFITQIPIYRIRDEGIKSKLTRAVLQKVEINNGSLNVVLGM